jgi:hypothetical protein
VSLGFYDFLKALDVEAAREYAYEKLGSRRDDVQDRVTESEPLVPKLGELPEDIFVTLDKCSPIDPVARYVRSRSIPRVTWGRLRAVPDFSRVVEYLPAYKGRIPNAKPRLALPCRDVLNNVTALVCRSVDGSEPRYVMLKVDEAEPVVFGLECVRYDRPVIVVEGPVDSLFLPNAVAVAGTDLPRIGKYLSAGGCYLVFDNQPRNREVIEAMRRAGEQGYRVCVWPDDTPGKDVNDMIKGGWTVDKIVGIIRDQSFTGLRLETEIAAWRKIGTSGSSGSRAASPFTRSGASRDD